MEYKIKPDPVEIERNAILSALAVEEAERPVVSAWAQALLPAREPEEDAP